MNPIVIVCLTLTVLIVIATFIYFMFNVDCMTFNIEDFPHKDLIHPKGPFVDSYSRQHTEQVSNEDVLIKQIKKSNSVLYIRKSDIQSFTNLLHHLEKPTILLTIDGDGDLPSDLPEKDTYDIINSELITKWYMQNYDKTITHPKLKHFPIGFDLHTDWRQVGRNKTLTKKWMLRSRMSSDTNNRIKNRIFFDYIKRSIPIPPRDELLATIRHNPHVDLHTERVSFKEITSIYNKYNFVISAPGHGVDCHRTWELFLAGVIIITITTSLDNMFIDNDLPVVILNNWEELNSPDLLENLEKWYNQYSKWTTLEHIVPRLTFSYWLDT